MNRQAQTAANLLAKYGEPVTVTFTKGVVYNPITGEANGVAVTNAVNAVGYASKYYTRDLDGVVIQAGDIRLILEIITPVPVVGCLVTVNETVYRVMNIQSIRLASQDVIFICQIRAN